MAHQIFREEIDYMDLATEQSAEIGELLTALAKAQGSIQPAQKDVEGQIGGAKKSYADLTSIVRASQEALSANGLCIVQTGEVRDDTTYLATTLGHSSGEWIRGYLPVLSGGPNKQITAAQAFGSASTYARRYGWAATVGVVTEDDDAATAGPTGNGQKDPPARETSDELRGEAKEKFLDGMRRWRTHLGEEAFDLILEQFELEPKDLPKIGSKATADEIHKAISSAKPPPEAPEDPAEIEGPQQQPPEEQDNEEDVKELHARIVQREATLGVGQDWAEKARKNHLEGVSTLEYASRELLESYSAWLKAQQK